MTEAHLIFDITTPDEVAETWDCVSSSLYEALWDCVPFYDNSHLENTEDMGPDDMIGINNVHCFWPRLSEAHKIELNILAELHTTTAR